MTAHRIRVRQLTDHPVVVSERHRHRPSPMWPGLPPLFPDWFCRRDIDAHFEVVDRDASVVVTTLSYHLSTDDLDRLESWANGATLVVIYTLDDLSEPATGGWDRSEEWQRRMRSFALSADLLVGPQLPRGVSHDRILPLPHGPVVPIARQPFSRRPARKTRDLYFSGAWYPCEGRPRDSRSREYRAYLLDLLTRELDDAALDLRRVHFWRTNPLAPGQPSAVAVDKRRLLLEHERSIDRALISLAPAGYGYYTTRHSDILARGGVLLTERIHDHIHLPDHDRWADGDVALLYDPDTDDIVDVVRAALADLPRLETVARSGWAYAKDHLTPRRQVSLLADTIRGLLS